MNIFKFFWEGIKDIFSYNDESQVEVVVVIDGICFAKNLKTGKLGYFSALNDDGEVSFTPEVGKEYKCFRGYCQVEYYYHACQSGAYEAELLYQTDDLWVAKICQDGEIVGYTFVYDVDGKAKVGSWIKVEMGSYVKIPSYCC